MENATEIKLRVFYNMLDLKEITGDFLNLYETCLINQNTGKTEAYRYARYC